MFFSLSFGAKPRDEHCLRKQTMFANQREALVPKVGVMPPTAAPCLKQLSQKAYMIVRACEPTRSVSSKGFYKEQRFAVIYKTQTRTLRLSASFRANAQAFAWNPRREKRTNPYVIPSVPRESGRRRIIILTRHGEYP